MKLNLLFLWYLPEEATESVAKYSSKLQPSINLYVPVTAFMFSCFGIDEGLVKPCAVIEPYGHPLKDFNPSGRIQSEVVTTTLPLHIIFLFI